MSFFYYDLVSSLFTSFLIASYFYATAGAASSLLTTFAGAASYFLTTVAGAVSYFFTGDGGFYYIFWFGNSYALFYKFLPGENFALSA